MSMYSPRPHPMWPSDGAAPTSAVWRDPRVSGVAARSWAATASNAASRGLDSANEALCATSRAVSASNANCSAPARAASAAVALASARRLLDFGFPPLLVSVLGVGVGAIAARRRHPGGPGRLRRPGSASSTASSSARDLCWRANTPATAAMTAITVAMPTSTRRRRLLRTCCSRWSRSDASSASRCETLASRKSRSAALRCEPWPSDHITAVSRRPPRYSSP